MLDKNTNIDVGNYFAELNKVDVSKHIEQKNGMSYLSWAWAWGELKKRHPDAYYTVYENSDGWNYFTDNQTCWVKTGVTVCGIEHIEYLPVMDFKNRSIPLGSVTSFDVNKSIQRSLTKAVARHGLGLYIYAGEDIPSETDASQTVKKNTPKKTAANTEEVKEPNEKAQTHRDLFRDYMNAKKIPASNISEILKSAGVGPDSPDEKWFEALCIAKKMFG